MKNRFVAVLVASLLAVPAFAQNPQQPATAQAQALPSLAPLIDSVKSAVVNVDVTSRGGAEELGQEPGGGGGDDFFDRFFGQGQGRGGRGQQPLRQGMGSGFIIDPSGIVLTNNHVVQGAVSIRVRLNDRREFDAKILGRDPATDVAVIKLQGKIENLPVVKLGDSDAIKVGDWVVAIGNPFGLASSVSVGIISAKAREIGASQYDDFLQTDAAINPGNSGGPLFNLKGEVIGINTAIVGGGSGIGFSVPSNMVTALLPQLEKNGQVVRGYLGVGIEDLHAEVAKGLGLNIDSGALVSSVPADGPARKAGVQPDDVIVAIDGQKLGSASELTRTVAMKKPGTVTTLTLYRGGKKMDVKVTLAQRPKEEVASADDLGGDEGGGEQNQKQVGLAFRDADPRTMQALGIESRTGGALITDVTPGSAAERAGLVRGMVVVEAAKKPVKNSADLVRAIKTAKSGSTVLLRVEIPQGQGRRLRALTVP